ncbi:helix-turn-helix domain-containing protein [Nocardioides nanhaiensis]|uniref:Helix-turn-helix domain-containing protein n=1 Tax=Nocardioides nanhaiensis TaxID=1476871 RepID=A0ABP8W4E3_9ACTN
MSATASGWVGVDNLLTPAAAARRLAVSTWTLNALRRSGAIPAVRVGRAYRYDPAALAAYVNRSDA